MKAPAWILLPALALPLWARPAAATRCSEWTRLPAQQKTAAIQGLAADLARNNRVRQTSVNGVALQQCLEKRVRAIQLDFDAACAESTDLQTLNRIFRHHAWSCVR